MDKDTLLMTIMSQTVYTKEQAEDKLAVHNNNVMNVLKEYMGIPSQKQDNSVKSINQEIYKQIRIRMNDSTREYYEKNPIKIEDVIQNLQEAEETFSKKYN
jgi:ATP-dependent Lon protease